MFTSQRKMMMRTRNSQWRQQQKPYQSPGEFFQRSLKHHSKVATKAKKIQDLEKIIFYDEFLPLKFKVASNYLILKNIMSHMTFSSLQTARLVSKGWKKVANLELKRRRCCRMHFIFGDSNISKNLEIIRGSDDISWIEFNCKYLKEEKMNEFATICRRQIKILTILPCPTFWDLLEAGKFQNLETLSFCKAAGKFQNRETFSFYKAAEKPTSRNCIRMKGVSNSNYDDIILALANLQGIEEIRLSDTSLYPSKFFELKSHLIKSVKLDVSRCSCSYSNCSTSLNQVSLLAQAKPKLERLVLKNVPQDPKVLEQIYLLLESSRESLQVVEMSHFLNSFDFQRSQSFNRLSILHFKIPSFGDWQMSGLVQFLESCRKDSLPNLKTIKFGFYAFARILFDSPYFSPEYIRKRGILSSVVNLELVTTSWFMSSKDLLASNWFPWLATLLPKVQNLTIGNWTDTDQILLQVFLLWPKLISLEIQTWHHSFGKNLDLNPILTGLSLEKCEELRKLQPENMMTEEILKSRIWPNLHSLKGLKRLDIILNKFSSSYSRSIWCPVSLVSFIYAINLKPELKTTIRYPTCPPGLWKFLQPLAPYARLEECSGNM